MNHEIHCTCDGPGPEGQHRPWCGRPDYDGDPGCFWHGAEPVPEGAYRVCLECGHCWVTAADLMADVQRLCMEIGATPPMDVEHVFYCPLCAHDF